MGNRQKRIIAGNDGKFTTVGMRRILLCDMTLNVYIL